MEQMWKQFQVFAWQFGISLGTSGLKFPKLEVVQFVCRQQAVSNNLKA